MHPDKLLKQHKSKKIKKGVYDVTWGTKKIRVIVLSVVPKSKKNALWNIFSNVPENIEYGIRVYQTSRSSSKLLGASSVFSDVFTYYGLEGLHMAYTMEQYQRDHFMRKLPQFVNDTKMQDGIFQTIVNSATKDKLLSLFPSEDIVSWLVARGRLSIDTVLSFFSSKDIVSRLSTDERLEGLSTDEIQAYLRTLKETSSD